MVDKLISLKEAADIMGLSPETLRNWDDSGKFPAIRTNGNHRRYSMESVLGFIEKPEDNRIFFVSNTNMKKYKNQALMNLAHAQSNSALKLAKQSCLDENITAYHGMVVLGLLGDAVEIFLRGAFGYIGSGERKRSFSNLDEMAKCYESELGKKRQALVFDKDIVRKITQLSYECPNAKNGSTEMFSKNPDHLKGFQVSSQFLCNLSEQIILEMVRINIDILPSETGAILFKPWWEERDHYHRRAQERFQQLKNNA